MASHGVVLRPHGNGGASAPLCDRVANLLFTVQPPVRSLHRAGGVVVAGVRGVVLGLG